MSKLQHTYFITFGDTYNFWQQAQRIANEAKNISIFDYVMAYSENDLPEFKKSYLDFALQSQRGFGYWLWKPFLIQQQLTAINDNDILVYCDAGCTINKKGKKRLIEYIEMAKNDAKGIIAFDLGLSQVNYTKMDTIIAVNNNSYFEIELSQKMATVIIIRKSLLSKKVITEWLFYSKQTNLLDDTPSVIPNSTTFVAHRHDQSIFSLLVNKYEVTAIADETYFGQTRYGWFTQGRKYPIWAIRGNKQIIAANRFMYPFNIAVYTWLVIVKQLHNMGKKMWLTTKYKLKPIYIQIKKIDEKNNKT